MGKYRFRPGYLFLLVFSSFGLVEMLVGFSNQNIHEIGTGIVLVFVVVAVTLHLCFEPIKDDHR